MDQERSEVRQVEEARERVAQDVRSVAFNANVVERAKETAKDRIRGAREKLESARDSMREMTNNLPGNPMENPLAMLLGGLAIGFLIGMVLPVSRFETERLGPVTEEMKGRMREAGNEMMRRGGEVIKETIVSARETATSSIREQTREMGLGGSEV